MTLETALITATGALSASTVALFSLQLRYIARIERENDQCFRERVELTARINKMENALIDARCRLESAVIAATGDTGPHPTGPTHGRET